MPLLKHLERLARRAGLALLARGSEGRRGGAIDLPERATILLIRTDRLGDAVISTPAIARLRERHSTARITLLLGAKNAAAASLIPGIDERMVLPVSLPGALTVLRQLRARRCDLAINLLAGGSATAALVTAFVRARWSIGFAGAGDEALSHRIVRPEHPEHVALTTSRLLAPLGIDPIIGDDRQHLILPKRTAAELPQGTILLLPSVGDPARRWPEERWRELARTLTGRGLAVAVLGTPNDSDMIERIAEGSRTQILPPSRSLGEFAGMVAGATIVVAPDTASVHIAAAAGRLTVMLAGEVRSAQSWYPWGVPCRLVRGAPSIAQITVPEVYAATLDLARIVPFAPFPGTREVAAPMSLE